MTDHPTTNNPVTVASNENKNFIAINVQLISPGDASDRLWMSILGMLGSRLGLHFAMILSSISGWKMRIQKAECVRHLDHAVSAFASNAPSAGNDVRHGSHCRTTSSYRACHRCSRPRQSARRDCPRNADSSRSDKRGSGQNTKTEEGNRCNASSEFRE